MKQLIEDLKNVLANMYESYTVENIYRFIVYTFLYASITKRRLSTDIIRPLRHKLPSPLIGKAENELRDLTTRLLDEIEGTLNSNKAVVMEEANLNEILNKLKYKIGKIDAVIIYDCMSLIEQILITSYLENNSIKSMFLDLYFINPIGKTSFVTQQLGSSGYRKTLIEVARYMARELRAKYLEKHSQIDQIVHKVGHIGLDAFLANISELVNVILKETLSIFSKKNIASEILRVLILSDHGYDIVINPLRKYTYVAHGYVSSKEDLVIIPFSKLTFLIMSIK